MKENTYLKQLQLYAQGIEKDIKSLDLNIEYYGNKLLLAEQHKGLLIEALKVAVDHIAAEERRNG